MPSLKTKKGDVEQESQAVAARTIADEFAMFVPPFRKTMYMYLTARAEGKQPPEEIAEALESAEKNIVDRYVKKFDEITCEISPLGQKTILAKLLKALEPEEAEHEQELARDEARDELLNSVGELPIPSQTMMYKSLKMYFECCGMLAAAS